MKQTITAIQVNIEATMYDENEQVVGRPQVQPVVAFQADIPAAVLQWIQEQLAKRGA